MASKITRMKYIWIIMLYVGEKKTKSYIFLLYLAKNWDISCKLNGTSYYISLFKTCCDLFIIFCTSITYFFILCMTLFYSHFNILIVFPVWIMSFNLQHLEMSQLTTPDSNQQICARSFRSTDLMCCTVWKWHYSENHGIQTFLIRFDIPRFGLLLLTGPCMRRVQERLKQF